MEKNGNGEKKVKSENGKWLRSEKYDEWSRAELGITESV